LKSQPITILPSEEATSFVNFTIVSSIIFLVTLLIVVYFMQRHNTCIFREKDKGTVEADKKNTQKDIIDKADES